MTEYHTLTITTDGMPEYYTSPWGAGVQLPEAEISITCTPAGCDGWQECWEDHAVDGRNAADGPFECDDDAPWCDEEEFEFHGQPHTWRYGHGWTVAYVGCVLAAHDISDYAWEILREYGPGEYLVDADWDDDSLYDLTAVSMADGSPLPEPGWAERTCMAQVTP